ncbi:MAG: thermonuclease family protein [Candidatus Altiarchaeota archaeon]|nr:thermonuclease family protein [Candidatus Altiarchaeota archaeon]
MIKLLYLVLALVYPLVEADLNYVIDGDTIDTTLGRVRILNINTPEKGERCFSESKNYLKNLNLTTLRLERDFINKDKYKRFLRHVYGDNLVGLDLVNKGLAKSYCIFPNLKYCSEIQSAQKTAMDNQVGCLWSESLNNSCIIISDVNKRGNLVELSNICGFEAVLDGLSIESDGRKKEEFVGTLCPYCKKTKSLEIGKFVMLFDTSSLIDYQVS